MNEDIFPPEEFKALYPALRPLIYNEAIARRFIGSESQALHYKALYMRVGLFSLICVGVTMTSLAARVTLPSFAALPRWTAWAGAAVALSGLAAQWVLLAFAFKNRWLMARFAAERLRCLKFQAFQVLTEYPVGAIQSATADFLEERFAELRLMKARDLKETFARFNPSDDFRTARAIAAPASQADLQNAYKAYRALRLDYQKSHYSDCAAQAATEAGWARQLGTVIYALATTAGFAAAIYLDLRPLSTLVEPLQNGLKFAVLLLFIASAVVAVYERAGIQEISSERYGQYRDQIEPLRQRPPPATWEDFGVLVRETEEVASWELKEFCMNAAKSNFIL